MLFESWRISTKAGGVKHFVVAFTSDDSDERKTKNQVFVK